MLRQNMNHHSFGQQEIRPYTTLKEEVLQVLSEGWAWLERECLLVPRPGSSGDFILSRKAKQIISSNQLEAYRRGNLLAGMLHPSMQRESKAAFLRGDYGLAVFNAFKQVEVAVREAGGFSWKDLGVDLMNEAFKPKVGTLTDKSLPEPEQLGLRSILVAQLPITRIRGVTETYRPIQSKWPRSFSSPAYSFALWTECREVQRSGSADSGCSCWVSKSTLFGNA